MPQVGVDEVYAGTESWTIQDSAAELQTYINDFKSQNTRTTILSQSDYSDGLGGKKSVKAFASKETIKALAANNAGTTLRTNVLGVALHFGFDGQKIVLIAQSANNKNFRPSGSDFTNFNFRSKEVGEVNPNASLLDSEMGTLISNFRSSGYNHLENLPNGTTRSVVFDNQILARLIYSDLNLNIAGQTTMHLVIAPPFIDEQGNLLSGSYLSIVAEGKNAQNNAIYRGNPLCPPHCYEFA